MDKKYMFIISILIFIAIVLQGIVAEIFDNEKKCTTHQEWAPIMSASGLVVSVIFSAVWGYSRATHASSKCLMISKFLMIVGFTVGLLFAGATLAQSMNYDNLCLLQVKPSSSTLGHSLSLDCNQLAEQFQLQLSLHEKLHANKDIVDFKNANERLALQQATLEEKCPETFDQTDGDDGDDGELLAALNKAHAGQAGKAKELVSHEIYRPLANGENNINKLKASKEQTHVTNLSVTSVVLLGIAIVVSHFSKGEEKPKVVLEKVVNPLFAQYSDSITY